MWSTKIFKANIIVIHKALLKLTKLLSHKSLESYSIITLFILSHITAIIYG